MHKINVGWMYPDLLNLHGERGSVQALVSVGKQLGIDVNVRRIEDFDDPIPFDELDLLIFLPGEISTLSHLVAPLQSSKLNEYLAAGGYLVAIGTSGLLFGKSVFREDGSTLDCLGLLDMTAKERSLVWGDDLHIRLNNNGLELAGSQIQMADVEAKYPLASTVYGMGNNNTGADGARWKNLIYTNCLGPLFVKNPWFAEQILKEILKTKGIEIQAEGHYPIARNAFDSTLEFIKTKPKKS